jgi:hypothetical protein
MLRYSKLNSKQAGAFTTPANRMIDIEIPQGMVCSLADSFIQLVLRLDTTSTVVNNLCLVSSSSDLIPMNLDLIRNCSLFGSKVGFMENIRRINILKHNLNTLMKSSEEKLSLVDSLYQTVDYYSNRVYSPFVDYNKEGNQASIYRDVSIRIPMKDLFELGSQVIDTGKTGALTIHLELESLSYLTFEEVKLFNSDEEGIVNDIAPGADLSTLTTATKYSNLELSPFFVGQQVEVDAVTDPVQTPEPNLTAVRTITSITRNQDLTLQLTISPALPDNVAPNNFTYKDITLTEADAAGTNSLVVATCELGMAEMVGQTIKENELQYLTWTSEEYSSGGQQQMNKIFEVEPEAVNAFLMFDSNSSNFISNNIGVTSYRMRIDNNDVYNRDILVNKDNVIEFRIHDALHYDSISRTFQNAGYPLKDMAFLGLKRNVEIGDVEYKKRFSDDDQQIMLLCAPMPLTAMTKKLQFNIVANKSVGAKVENVILYKQVVRSIKF